MKFYLFDWPTIGLINFKIPDSYYKNKFQLDQIQNVWLVAITDIRQTVPDS